MRTNDENPVESLSEPQRGYRNRELFDLKAFQDYLKSKGIRIVLNDITQVPSVRGFGEKQYGKQNAIKALPANIEGELKRMYTNVSLNGIREYIEVEAMDRENHFNPVLEYFEGKEYDGKDHLAEVFRALRIEDDRLSQVLIYKWFLQGWALLYNDPDEPYAADGVLTLAGPQGCGKTTFFEKCAIKPEFFRSGQSISTHDKDPERRAITTWISELGEVGCTFKSGLDELKKFITQERDEYRLSYARYDVVAPRRTNLGATVNGDQYLIDETGNRRFWTVPLTKDVDHHALRYDIDWTQVWLEVRAKSKFDTFIDDRDKRSACYRLTPEQRAALDERNVDCEKALEYEDEVREVLTNCEQFGAQRRKTSVKAWIDHNTILSETCHNDTRKSQKVGKVLDKLGYPVEGKDGKHGRWRMLPWI
jgi:predicted P-loop ATPase